MPTPHLDGKHVVFGQVLKVRVTTTPTYKIMLLTAQHVVNMRSSHASKQMFTPGQIEFDCKCCMFLSRVHDVARHSWAEMCSNALKDPKCEAVKKVDYPLRAYGTVAAKA